MVSLSVLARKRLKVRELLERLDSLCNDLEPEIVRQHDNRANDLEVLALAHADPADEGAIDLQDVDRKAVHVTE